MDAECVQGLKLHGGRYYCLSKELEKIHLGTYNAHQLRQMSINTDECSSEQAIMAAMDGKAVPLTAADSLFLRDQASLRYLFSRKCEFEFQCLGIPLEEFYPVQIVHLFYLLDVYRLKTTVFLNFKNKMQA